MLQICVFFLSQVPAGLYAVEWLTGRRPWIGLELLNEKALKSLEFLGLLAQEPWGQYIIIFLVSGVSRM